MNDDCYEGQLEAQESHVLCWVLCIQARLLTECRGQKILLLVSLFDCSTKLFDVYLVCRHGTLPVHFKLGTICVTGQVMCTETANISMILYITRECNTQPYLVGVAQGGISGCIWQSYRCINLQSGIALVITTSMLLCLLTLAQQFISYFSSCIKCHASQEHQLYKTNLKQIQMDQWDLHTTRFVASVSPKQNLTSLLLC